MPACPCADAGNGGVHFGTQNPLCVEPEDGPLHLRRNVTRSTSSISRRPQPMYAEAANFLKGVIADGGTCSLSAPSDLRARCDQEEEAERCPDAVRQSALARRHASRTFQDDPPVESNAWREINGSSPRAVRRKRGKKEATQLRPRDGEAFERSLGGIKDMNFSSRRLVLPWTWGEKDRGPPSEENRLPVVAIVDTNSSAGFH